MSARQTPRSQWLGTRGEIIHRGNITECLLQQNPPDHQPPIGQFVTIIASATRRTAQSAWSNLAVVLGNRDFMKNRNILIKEIGTEDSKLVLRRIAPANAIKLTRENALKPLPVESRGGFYRPRNACLPTHAR